MSSENRQGMIRFGIVGIINTMVDIGVFTILYRIAEIEPLLANTIAFLIAVSNSYLLNHHWTFQQPGASMSLSAYARFVVVNIGGLILGTLAILLLGRYMPLELSKLIATGITFIWNYTSSKMFVFKEKKHE